MFQRNHARLSDFSEDFLELERTPIQQETISLDDIFPSSMSFHHTEAVSFWISKNSYSILDIQAPFKV